MSNAHQAPRHIYTIANDMDRVLRMLLSDTVHISPLSGISGADVQALRTAARHGLCEWSVTRGGYVITDAGRAALRAP